MWNKDNLQKCNLNPLMQLHSSKGKNENPAPINKTNQLLVQLLSLKLLAKSQLR